MRVWRLCKSKFAASAFSGNGARVTGGRWNPKGVAVVYTTETPSLALLELLVHVEKTEFPPHCVLIPADIPDSLPRTVWTPSQLPRGWRKLPCPNATRQKGARWVRAARTAVLIVPSAIVPYEHIVILNPAHPDFRQIKIGKPIRFAIDTRL